MIDTEHPDHDLLIATNSELLIGIDGISEDALTQQGRYFQDLSLNTNVTDVDTVALSMAQIQPWSLSPMTSPDISMMTGLQPNSWPQDMLSHYGDDLLYSSLGVINNPVRSYPDSLVSMCGPSSSPSLSHIRHDSYSTSSSPFSPPLVDFGYLNCEVLPLSVPPGRDLQSEVHHAVPLGSTDGHHQMLSSSSPSPELPWTMGAAVRPVPLQSFPPTPCAADVGMFPPLVTHENSPEPSTIEQRRALARQRIVRTRQRSNKSQTKARPQCTICNLDFSRRHNLTCHMKTHDPVQKDKYPCNECSLKFVRALDLKRHVKCTHRKLRPFRCDICDKCFSRKDTLRRHVEGNCYDRCTMAIRAAVRRPTKKAAAAERSNPEVKQEIAAASSSLKARRITNPNYMPALETNREAAEQQQVSADEGSLDLIAFVIKQE